MEGRREQTAESSINANDEPLMSVSERVKLLNRRQSPPRDARSPVRQQPPTRARAKYSTNSEIRGLSSPYQQAIRDEVSRSVSAASTDDEDRQDTLPSAQPPTAAATPVTGRTVYDGRTVEAAASYHETPLCPKKLTFAASAKPSPHAILRSTGKLEKKLGRDVPSRRVVSFSDVSKDGSAEGNDEDKSAVSRLSSQFNRSPSPLKQPVARPLLRSQRNVEVKVDGTEKVIGRVALPTSLTIAEEGQRSKQSGCGIVEDDTEQWSSTTLGRIRHFATRNPTFIMTTVRSTNNRAVSPKSSASATGTQKAVLRPSTTTDFSAAQGVSAGSVTQRDVPALEVDTALLPLAERVKLFDRRTNLDKSQTLETAPSAAESDAGVGNCAMMVKVMPFSGCSAKTGDFGPQAAAPVQTNKEKKIHEQSRTMGNGSYGRGRNVLNTKITDPTLSEGPSVESDGMEAPDLMDIKEAEGIDDGDGSASAVEGEAQYQALGAVGWVDFTSDNRSIDSRLSDLHSTDGDLWRKWNHAAAAAAVSLADASTQTSDAESIGIASEVTREDLDSTFGRQLDTSEWSSRETIRRLAALSKTARANAYAASSNAPRTAPGKAAKSEDPADGNSSVGTSTASDFLCFDPEETTKHFAELSKAATAPPASRQEHEFQQRNLAAFVPYAPRSSLPSSQPKQRTIDAMNERSDESRMATFVIAEAGGQREVPPLTEAGSSSAESAASESSVNDRVKLFDKARGAGNRMHGVNSPFGNIKEVSSDGCDIQEHSSTENSHKGEVEQTSLQDRIRRFGGSKDPSESSSGGTSAFHSVEERISQQTAGEASIGSVDRPEAASHGSSTKPAESRRSQVKVHRSTVKSMTSTFSSRRPPRIADNNNRRGQIAVPPVLQRRKTPVISRIRLLDSGASVCSAQSHSIVASLERAASEEMSLMDPTDESIELALAPSRSETPVMRLEEQENRRRSSTSESMTAVLQARNVGLALADSEGDDTLGGCSADAVTTEQPSFTHSKSLQAKEKKQGRGEHGAASLHEKIKRFGGGIATNETSITESSSSTSGGDAVFGSIEPASSSPTTARSARQQQDAAPSQAVSAVEEEEEEKIDDAKDVSTQSTVNIGMKSGALIKSNPNFKLWEKKTVKSAWV